MDWLTPAGSEHVIIGAPPVGADRQLLGGLAGAVLPEDVDRAGVDADSARSAGLSRPGFVGGYEALASGMTIAWP